MKKILLVIAIFFCLFSAASGQSMPPADKSPLDISYCPVNYPLLRLQDKVTESLTARVLYSRPAREGRTIYGGLIEYGKIWRMGANEATEIEFYKNVKIGDRQVPKGRYTLYAVVNEDSWTFVINKDTDCWGAFRYDEKKDVARLTVPVRQLEENVEIVSMVFEKTPGGSNLVVAWGEVSAALPIVF